MSGKKPSGKKPILNCSVNFEFECPMDWGELAPTADENIRHCSACNKKVFFCVDDAAMVEHARRDDCVAGEWLGDGDFEPVEWVGGIGLKTEADFLQMDIEIQMDALKAAKQKR